MAGSKVLVLGCTGPGGICILRELLYRNHATIAYARTPSKIPEELANNPKLEIIEGTMEDTTKLETAIAQSHAILSIMGPNPANFPLSEHQPYPGYYASIFPLMRRHGVRRILAMSTIAAADPQDRFSVLAWLMCQAVWVVAGPSYRTMQGIVRTFQELAGDLDWTVFRLAGMPGASDAQGWKRERESAECFVGHVGHDGWSITAQRAVVAKWLVDTVESGDRTWVGKIPTVANRKGG